MTFRPLDPPSPPFRRQFDAARDPYAARVALGLAGAPGSVSSLNGQTGPVTIAAGTGIGVVTSTGTITISGTLFSSIAQGEVPASGGGTTKFLRADGTWVTPPGGGGGRTALATATNFFVRTDGSDLNNGLTDTAGGAFLTWQAAWNNLTVNYDLAGQAATIKCTQVGVTFTSGITNFGSWVGGGSITLDGGSNTISRASGSCLTGGGVLGGVLTIQNFTLATASGSLISFGGKGEIDIAGGMAYGSCTSGFGIAATNAGANIYVHGNYSITGGGAYHIAALSQGQVYLDTVTVTITGTPSFSGAFLVALDFGLVDVSNASFSGSATGKIHVSHDDGLLIVNGTTPGSIAGTQNFGGGVIDIGTTTSLHQFNKVRANGHSTFGSHGDVDFPVFAPGDPVNAGAYDIPAALVSNDYASGDLSPLVEYAGILSYPGIKHTGAGHLGAYAGIDVECVVNSDSTGPIDNCYGTIYLMVNYGTGNIGNLYGLSLIAQNGGTATVSGEMVAGDFSARHLTGGSGALPLQVGGRFAVLFGNSAGAITNAKAGHFTFQKFASQTITNISGVEVDDFSGLGGTTSYNIYSKGSSSINLLEGTTKIGAGLTPNANDGAALGTTALQWSDLFLASGAVVNFNNGDVTLTHGTDVLTVAGGGITLAAGTTTIAPAKFQSGTNLTTPAAGALEYDGNVLYGTCVASARQVLDAEQIIVQSGTRTFTNNTSAQAIFNATANGAVTLAAATTYEFEMLVDVQGYSASAHTINLGFAGTATFTGIAYLFNAQSGSTAATPTAALTGWIAVATASAVIASSTTTGLLLYVRGTMRINAGGTVIPQLTQVTASAAAILQTNSFFRCWPIGTNTVTNVGNWS